MVSLYYPIEFLHIILGSMPLERIEELPRTFRVLSVRSKYVREEELCKADLSRQHCTRSSDRAMQPFATTLK